MKLFEFKFFNGQAFRGRGTDERDALVRMGLGAYNPVAYEAREIIAPKEPSVPRTGEAVTDAIRGARLAALSELKKTLSS